MEGCEDGGEATLDSVSVLCLSFTSFSPLFLRLVSHPPSLHCSIPPSCSRLFFLSFHHFESFSVLSFLLLPFLTFPSFPQLFSFSWLDLTSLCFVFSSLPPINFCSLPLLLTPLLSVLLFSFLSFYFFLYILPLSFFFPVISLLCIYSSFL